MKILATNIEFLLNLWIYLPSLPSTPGVRHSTVWASAVPQRTDPHSVSDGVRVVHWVGDVRKDILNKEALSTWWPRGQGWKSRMRNEREMKETIRDYEILQDSARDYERFCMVLPGVQVNIVADVAVHTVAAFRSELVPRWPSSWEFVLHRFQVKPPTPPATDHSPHFLTASTTQSKKSSPRSITISICISQYLYISLCAKSWHQTLRYQLTTGHASSMPYFSFSSFLTSWRQTHRSKRQLLFSIILHENLSFRILYRHSGKQKSSSVVAGVIRSTIELGNLSRRLEIRCSCLQFVRLELLKVTVYIRINLCRRKSTLGVFRPQWHLQAEQASSTPLLLIANSTFTLGNQTKRGRLTMQTIKTKLLYILRNPGFQAAVDFSCTWWHLRRNVRCWKVHPIPSVPTVGRSCHFQDSHLCLAAVLLGKFREIRLWGKHLISF